MSQGWKYFKFDVPRTEFIVGPEGRSRLDMEVDISTEVSMLLRQYGIIKTLIHGYNTSPDTKSFVSLELPVIPSGKDSISIGQFPLIKDAYITDPGVHSLRLEDEYGYTLLSLCIADPMRSDAVLVRDQTGSPVSIDMLSETSDALRIARAYLSDRRFPSNGPNISTSTFPIAVQEPEFREVVASL